MSPFARTTLAASSLLFFAYACTVEESPDDDDSGAATTDGVTSSSSLGSTGTATSGPVSGVTTGSGTATSTGSGMMGGITFLCNPITNEPCGPGEACDLSTEMEFVCFGPPNTQEACESCDLMQNSFCVGGFSCQGNACARFCCNDDDCGPSATCDLVQGQTFGTCLITGGGTGGSGGNQGTGGMGGAGGMG
ncbi:MAG: hypothetical protein AAGN82_19800, partial [Myxococcota bacterium]